MKTTLPRAVTLGAAAMVCLTVFFGVWPKVTAELDKWFILSGAVACCVGLVNLTRVHIRTVSRRSDNWESSIILLVATYATLVLGISTGPVAPAYNWVFQTTVVPLSATFLALLGFYITSAAYRAFRVRSSDAAILLVSAFLVLLGRAPIGAMIWPGFESVTRWIMDIPNTAGMRAVTMCAILGAIMTALRIAAGIERSHLGAE